ncbi:WhiB family transcriptional regulator [Humibacter sp.]|uniref:WhiB family transcriptional regulator n=1 Tax=Humibacter sp. TaxID=1940291 RepID=UPI002C8DA8F5|nr:WhiB family transcriptional regulator [Humibacter sp.]HVX07202.1 WhiB family transcriptional regulator [Humibacter sp.]
MAMSEYRPGVPENWFVDPIRLGVPGVRSIEEDEENPLAWQSDALCAQTDPEAFFPEKGGSTRDAKKICTSCEVRAQCLEYALQNDERFGIWGGLSERERRKLRKRAG